MRDEAHFWYRVLEVEEGTSWEDITNSWCDLVRVWHPENFLGDERLQRRCRFKLLQLNFAYEGLRRLTGVGRSTMVH